MGRGGGHPKFRALDPAPFYAMRDGGKGGVSCHSSGTKGQNKVHGGSEEIRNQVTTVVVTHGPACDAIILIGEEEKEKHGTAEMVTGGYVGR